MGRRAAPHLYVVDHHKRPRMDHQTDAPSLESLRSRSVSCRSSCDGCRFRKVRCDRMQKVEQGRRGCTSCATLGLACVVTPVEQIYQAKKRRNGRRVKALLEGHATLSASGHRVTAADATASVHAIIGAISDPSSEQVSPSDREAAAPPSPQAQFLSVPGLTRAKLDYYVEAFFRTLEPCMPLSFPSTCFWPRYQAFLNLISGLPAGSTTGDIEPLSELLVLAVACRGCVTTKDAGRYRSSRAIRHRFVQLASTGDAIHHAGLDGIEAINLLSEMECQPKHLIAKHGKEPTALRYSVVGRNFSVELALFMQLQMPLSHFTAEERARRRFLFWTIFMHDAFCSAAANHMYRIMDEDVGWSTQERSADSGPSAKYGVSMAFLAYIARQICRDLLSCKAKSQGIQPGKVVEILASLQRWLHGLEAPYTFDWSQPDLESRTEREHLSTDELATASRRAFMLTIFLSLHLSIWASISDAGYANGRAGEVEAAEADATLDAAMVLSCFRMAALARHCRYLALVDHAPNNLRNVPAAWVLWCTRRVGRALRSGAALQDSFQLRQACQDLIGCVASAQSCSDNEALVKSLQGMIDQVFFLEQRCKDKGQTMAGAPEPFPHEPPSKRLRPLSHDTLTAVHSRGNAEGALDGFTDGAPATLYLEGQDVNMSTPMSQASRFRNGPEGGQEYRLDNMDMSATLSPDWVALGIVTADVQAFLASFGFEMSDGGFD